MIEFIFFIFDNGNTICPGGQEDRLLGVDDGVGDGDGYAPWSGLCLPACLIQEPVLVNEDL